ncbi:MAG: hypothetical protein GEU71_17320 [Actinobacteria bacterium]|nr:hypothetical protein [Actinomycetota bacterium]
MAVVSIRFSDAGVHRRLKNAADGSGLTISSLAERLIDEGLRMESHPLIVFRDGPTGRRPVLARGPDVADVVSGTVGGDVPVEDRHTRAAGLLGLSVAQVDAAMAYYAEFTDEIDAHVIARADLARREQAAWQRQRELLER